MDTRRIEFKVQRDGETVTGFSLTGCGQHEAEAFCVSFPTAINLGKGDVKFEEGSITFVHGGVLMGESESGTGVWGFSSAGKYSCPISAEDQKAIEDLFASGSFRVRREFGFAKGFTLYRQ